MMPFSRHTFYLYWFALPLGVAGAIIYSTQWSMLNADQYNGALASVGISVLLSTCAALVFILDTCVAISWNTSSATTAKSIGMSTRSTKRGT